jgi:FAD/FMN-containing dehydrogenase
MTIMQELINIVGEKHVVTGVDLERYSIDWMKQYPSSPIVAVRPASTQEVSEIVQLANKHGIAIVPMGGNTGLTGATQANGAIVLSTERMNAIRSIRKSARIAIVEAGAILANVHTAVDDHDMIFPLTFGARGSATIGGVLGTNAGGSNVLRYGNTRDLVLGIEVVLPTGEIMDLMSELHKDNSGYNLRHLLIGAEGTLGIITAAVLKLSPKPKAYATAMVAVQNLNDALTLLNRLQEETGRAVEAFEYMPRNYIDAHLAHFPAARAPFDEMYDVNIMVELGTTIDALARTNDQGKIIFVDQFETILGEFFEQGMVLDAVVAQNEAQRAEMWQRREAAAELSFNFPNIVNNDVALPLDRVSEFLDRAGQELAQIDPEFKTFVVSHLGDGNIHYVVSASRKDAEVKNAIMETVENIVLDMGGSFSAEHGIGVSKLPSMHRRKDKIALDVMRKIKAVLDPENIMNPGKVLP